MFLSHIAFYNENASKLLRYRPGDENVLQFCAKIIINFNLSLDSIICEQSNLLHLVPVTSNKCHVNNFFMHILV